MIEGLDVVFAHVTREETVAWYRDVLGLPLSFDDGHWAEFGASDRVRFAVDRVPDDRSDVEMQSIVASFRVSNVAETIEALREKGVVFLAGPDGPIHDVGPALVASFRDPEGNWLQISQQVSQQKRRDTE